MLVVFGIGIFGSTLSTVECRCHMMSIMQLGFICISQSNCLITVEMEMGFGARKRDLQALPGLERTTAVTALYDRCSSKAVSSLGMSSIPSCPHASSSRHQRRSPALA